MMAYHFIAIANYYTGGFRIGWHYASNDNLDKAVIQDFLSESNKRFSNSEYRGTQITYKQYQLG